MPASSGKSHFFGELMVEECLMVPGTLVVCIREVQKSLMQSSKRLIESKIQQLGVGDQFKILHDRIATPGGPGHFLNEQRNGCVRRNLICSLRSGGRR
jgi:hypothetical protein